MRKGVVVTLMETGSPNALNGLRRALGDVDFEVRYCGVLGLGRITDGDGAMLPNMEQFKADETKYVSYWRERPVPRASRNQ
jgi:HEAT repeat protein